MEKININYINFETDKIDKDFFKKTIVKLNKVKNFNIYIPKINNVTWVIIDIKNKGIVYIEKGYFGGINISSCCIPNINTGNGSMIYKNTYDNIINKINNSINKYYNKSKPYKNIEQYLKNNHFKYNLILKKDSV